MQIHIALYEPEIPQNTGNIGRLCLGLGARLHLIHPLGFRIDEKAVRRAGLDYWKHVDIQEHENAAAFWQWAEGRRVFGLSTKAQMSPWSVRFEEGDVLLMGPETRGLPREVLDRVVGLRLPMKTDVRSLNLANATAVVAYQAMSQLKPDWFSVAGH
jgi:tRNA (cytidine/uridine-2'-O-)-methyltransferase